MLIRYAGRMRVVCHQIHHQIVLPIVFIIITSGLSSVLSSVSVYRCLSSRLCFSSISSLLLFLFGSVFKSSPFFSVQSYCLSPFIKDCKPIMIGSPSLHISFREGRDAVAQITQPRCLERTHLIPFPPACLAQDQVLQLILIHSLVKSTVPSTFVSSSHGP